MNKKQILAAVIAVLLLVALLQIDHESLLYSIRQIPLWLVALMLGLQIATQLLINLQWYVIARLSGTKITFLNMFLANCQGNIIDSITPGVKFGGEVTRAVKISQTINCTGEQAAALVAVQKIFSLSAMLTIISFVIGMPFLALLLLLFFAPIRIKQKPPRFSWMKRVRGFFIEVKNQAGKIRKNKLALAMVFLLSLFIWFLYPVKMYILAIQFYPAADFINISVVTFSSYIVAMIPIFPGGLGGFEGTMSGLLVAMGVVISDAAVITVFFRFVTFWFVMLFSLKFKVCHKILQKLRLRG
ncbi:MAG: flippase-like domain-containing protein [Defluviitaleaceae bacterium]|nr:flippase-like domain-containing protein [Defluviitaleaceae bacterium]